MEHVYENRKGLFPHRVVRAHAQECYLLRAHMYKSAKKKFNNEAIQEAIDIAKLNVSRRKLQ